MSKLITRNVTHYVYTIGRYNLETSQMEDIRDIVRLEPMPSRHKRAIANDGYLILNEAKDDVLMGMTLEDFAKYAKPVDEKRKLTGGEDGE